MSINFDASTREPLDLINRLYDWMDSMSPERIEQGERTLLLEAIQEIETLSRLRASIVTLEQNLADAQADNAANAEEARRLRAHSSVQPLHPRHPHDVEGSEYLPEVCIHQWSHGTICRECALVAVRRLATAHPSVPQEQP